MKQIRLHSDGRSRVCLSAFLPKGGQIISGLDSARLGMDDLDKLDALDETHFSF